VLRFPAHHSIQRTMTTFESEYIIVFVYNGIDNTDLLVQAEQY
jgi:hypothetical protein